MSGNHVVVVGGCSVNEPNHDAYPTAFLEAGVSRIKQQPMQGRINQSVMIMFTPSYTLRVLKQKVEHPEVHPNGNPRHFWNFMVDCAGRNGFTLLEARSGGDVTRLLKQSAQIQLLDFFGHSNKKRWLLDFGKDGTDNSTEAFGREDLMQLANSFTNDALFASFGCFQGQPIGLCHMAAYFLHIRAMGSTTRTDYERRDATTMLPSGSYQEYTPSKDPAKPLTADELEAQAHRVAYPFE